MDLPPIESFSAKFEDVNIHIDKFRAIEFIDDNERELKYSATVSIHEFRVARHVYTVGRGLAGDLVITFRNQGNHFDSVIMTILDVRVYSPIDNDGASVYAKFIQYYYDWMGKYVRENQIMDMEGKEAFKLPAYNLSKANFQHHKD